MTSFWEEGESSKKDVKVGNYDKFVFPTVRKSYPSLVAKDLVDVQPMGPRPIVRVRCYDPEDCPWLEKEEHDPLYTPQFFVRYKHGTKKLK